MSWIAWAAGIWVGGAAAAWALRRNRWGVAVAVPTVWAGSIAVAVSAFQALSGLVSVAGSAWTTPFGAFTLRLDPVAAVFLLPIAIVGPLAATYGPAYARLGHGPGHDRVAAQLAAFEILLASMVLVALAGNMVLLLVAWEFMTLSSWYLLASEHHDREVRSAGIGYLIAGHVSAGALALLFVFLVHTTGSWLVPAAPIPVVGGAPSATALFILMLIGFGTKAAVAPLHVWLPDAHSAAPSHVSALMSGVLITLGFYGLVRFLPALGPPPAVWGLTLMGLGGFGACLGMVMALSQGDVKRVLAYSTVENAGFITLAMGIALLGTAARQPLLTALAWSAALLHLWYHAVAKSLLFLSAGAVSALVGSRDLEHWGGILRRQRLLGCGVVVGAAALVGLPGTHVFASEWLLVQSLFHGGQLLTGIARLAMLLGLVAAAFAAGAALASCVRVVGVGLLGHPRSPEAACADQRPGAGVALPVILLGAACFGLVPAVQATLALLARAIEALVPGAPLESVARLAAPLPWLAVWPLAGGALALAARAFIRHRRPVRWAVTWDCGYARPDGSMQYTASSLAQPVTSVLQPALRTSVTWTPPKGLWPGAMTWTSRTPERALVELYRPAFLRLANLLGFFRRLQEGRVMVYLRYVGVALLVLLAWLFFPMEMPR